MRYICIISRRGHTKHRILIPAELIIPKDCLANFVMLDLQLALALALALALLYSRPQRFPSKLRTLKTRVLTPTVNITQKLDRFRSDYPSL